MARNEWRESPDRSLSLWGSVHLPKRCFRIPLLFSPDPCWQVNWNVGGNLRLEDIRPRSTDATFSSVPLTRKERKRAPESEIPPSPTRRDQHHSSLALKVGGRVSWPECPL